MKKGFRVLFCLMFSLAILAAVAITTGVLDLDDIGFSSGGRGIADDLDGIRSQLSDHQPPSGDGQPLEGELPEDKIPDAESRYRFPPEQYPYRAMLSADEQSAYDQVYAYAMELYDRLPLHTPISVDAISRTMSALYYDHPELFWVETAYQYSYTSQDNVVAVTLLYNETAGDIETHRNRYNSILQQVVAGAGGLDTAVEREKYVHDYLLDNVSYRLSADMNQSAYSALVLGETVCAGYARAFQHILLELGIPTYYCAGYAGEAHAWNIVKLDDGYYHVDVAWDDPLGNESGRRYYNYFNLTDRQIAADHTRTDLSLNLPACTATTYQYESVFGELETGGDSGLRTPEEAGQSPDSAVATMAEYYQECGRQIAELGTGTHTFALLIQNKGLLDEIFRLTESGAAMERYLPEAVAELGLVSYTANVSLQGESLTDDYWLLTQQVRLEGERAQESQQPALEPPAPSQASSPEQESVSEPPQPQSPVSEQREEPPEPPQEEEQPSQEAAQPGEENAGTDEGEGDPTGGQPDGAA